MIFFSKNPREALKYRYYFLPTLLITLAGVGDTLYLALSHYRNYTDISYASFCVLSKAINCDTVSQSPWSILFDLPVALWGLLAYLFFLIILLPTRKNKAAAKSMWSVLFILGLIFSCSALFFGYISSKKIHAYCLMCVFSYILSFGLLFYSWIIRRRFCTTSLITDLKNAIFFAWKSTFIKTGIVILSIMLLLLQLYLPHYWQYEFPALSTDIRYGITNNGHPWIGASEPKLTIEEYSDYLCFQCRKTHYLLRRLIAEHPGTIRLIHHNYPMDHTFNPIVVPEPFHIGSGNMALLAIYASTKDQFWKMNDILYTLGRRKKSFSTELLEAKTGIPSAELAGALQHPAFRQILLNDIRQGMKLGITGTPTFVINGKTYDGYIPPEIIDAVIR